MSTVCGHLCHVMHVRVSDHNGEELVYMLLITLLPVRMPSSTKGSPLACEVVDTLSYHACSCLGS